MTKRSDSVAGERLKSFIERIERLEEERTSLGADVREVYGEAKGAGFDVKVMRQVVKLRKIEPAERAEMDELLDLYLQALGMGGGGAHDVAVDDGEAFIARPVVEAAQLYNEGLTVEQVGERLGLSKSEAGKLRQRAQEAKLLTVERGRGRPAKAKAEKVSAKSEAETNSGQAEPEPADPGPEKVSRNSEAGDIPDFMAAADGVDPDPGVETEVAQPEPVIEPGDATQFRRSMGTLLRDGTATVEFGGKVYGRDNVDELQDDLPRFLDRSLWSPPGSA